MPLMKIDDEIRLKVFEALLQDHSVSANIRQIQKLTGFHKATIKASLEFLKKNGVLKGFGPKIDFKKFGYSLEAIVLWQVDMSNKKKYHELLAAAKNDKNLYRLSEIIGSNNWNLMSHHVYKDVESYHKDITKKYYEKIPGLFEIIKDRQIFFETEPFHKMSSRTEAIIDIIRKEKGVQ